MAILGFLGGKEAWYTMTEATLQSIVKPIWETVSSPDNLKAASSAALDIVIQHPLTATLTVAVGVAVFVAYKRRRFAAELGHVELNVETSLAHVNLSTGLGRKKPTAIEELKRRITKIEESVREGRDNEQRHHNANVDAIQNLRTVLLNRFTNVTETLEANAELAKANQKTLVGNHTALLQQMGANQTQLTKALENVTTDTKEIRKQHRPAA